MQITPEDIDEIAERVVTNTIRKVFPDDELMPCSVGMRLGQLRTKLIENIKFNLKAKLEVLPGQANDPAKAPAETEVNPLDRFANLPNLPNQVTNIVNVSGDGTP